MGLEVDIYYPCRRLFDVSLLQTLHCGFGKQIQL